MARFPHPVPPNVPVQRGLDDLAPGFRDRLHAVVATMRAHGESPLVVETLRTDARQAFLHGFGRLYDDGRGVVTHSRDADETWHGFGLAADLVCATDYWDARPVFWAVLGEAAAVHGLTWGGDWNGNGRSDDERFLDRPHVQFGPPMRRSPSPAAARLRAEGGLPAVWRAVGALDPYTPTHSTV
jgi:peptidoglycan LD-endopeptidase CwlK